MSLLRGAAFSFGCAALGAAVWAGISVAADMRLGLLGIVVGGLAGFGMGMGNRGRGGVWAGVAAAAITLVATLGSRAYVANITASRMVTENLTDTQELARETLNMEVASEMADEGIELTETEEGWPPEVIVRAERQWNALTDQERAERVQAADEMQQTGAAVATGAITVVALLIDFGLFGFVFVGLAMATAYKIGASRSGNSARGEATLESDAEASGSASVPTAATAPALRGFPAIKPEDDEDPLERLKRLRAKQAAADAAATPPPSHAPGAESRHAA